MIRRRFRNTSFRSKLLLLGLLPAALVSLVTYGIFSIGLERVWEDAVLRQALLLRLDSLVREYQSETREYLLGGLPETLEELEEIEEEMPGILADLAAQNARMARAADTMASEIEAMVQSRKRLGASLDGKNLIQIPMVDAEGELEVFESIETGLEERIDLERQAAALEVSGALTDFRRSMLAAAALGIGVGLLFAWAMGRWLTVPLETLHETSERILDGEYRVGELMDTGDEFGRLASAFDRAAVDVRRLLAQKEEHLDILQRNQAQLLQSGKLAAVGELAAGVAHEFNNPLSAVLTYSVLLRERAETLPPEALEAMPKLVERLALIESAAVRCQSVADNLLTFARRDEARKRSVNLATAFEESLGLMRHLLQSHSVRLEKAFEVDVPRIWGNGSQMQQVIVNLVSNALHAVDAGGVIRVGLRRDGERALITVADDGPGIDPAVRDRLFEPFVTTKAVGEGTGLGLSIVHGIVQGHGGSIEVSSGDLGGALFEIILPGYVPDGGP